MMGNWSNAIHYVLPLISFAAGVFLTEQIEYRFKNNKRLHWRQVVLIIEILLLGAVGFMPEELNVAANMMVSCIGNLRSGTESLSHYLRDQDRSSLIKACHFFGIILFFAIGAGVGGIMSKVFLVRTIWISMLLLAAVTVMMGRETVVQ